MQAKIKVKNGYWTFNGKPLTMCSFPERQIVSLFIKNSIFDIVEEEQLVSSLAEIDLSEYNYNLEFVQS